MDMQQAQQTFVAESRELIDDMERRLLELESDAGNAEAMGALFRAAHTIKGSAGLFGLDPIVNFTHVVENVLDRVRSHEVAMNADLIALLLSCGDHIGRLIEQVAVQGGAPDAETRAAGEALLKNLRTFASPKAAGTAAASTCETVTEQQDGDGAFSSGPDHWHISLRFGPDVLRNGMDPLSFLRYLKTLGEIVQLETLFARMPVAHAMDPESCYLGFEIALKSQAPKEAIAAVFDFVKDDCLIRILAPHSRIDEYVELIRKLPEENPRIGELLVKCGTLTAQELEMALNIQTQEKHYGEPVRPLGEILVEQKTVHPYVVEAAAEKQKQARDNRGAENRSIRIQADKLDHLINLVGELVTAADSANLHAQRLNDEGLYETVSLVSRLVSEIRDSSLVLRMVQIGETFNRFHRVVHDVSKEIGKDIGLEVGGKETELDKSVIERISDPLMHLVRNAMDHGIEPAEARRAGGKPEKGTVRLNARHDAGSIVIEVSDDGGGLNKEKILAKARERGLVGASQELGDEEVYKLIFEPGFSTADKVTNLSGRGVGMDVVRRNIEALRGTVEIDSKYGHGTAIRIRLPLTLAIIDAFLMGVGEAAYVAPLDAVVECIDFSDELRRQASDHHYINLRGEVLPFLQLREIFGLPVGARRAEHIVVVQYGGKKVGLVADRLLGEFQAVIKPLAKLFGNLRGLSGSTILGSGDVALILDIPALVQQAVNAEAPPGKHLAAA